MSRAWHWRPLASCDLDELMDDTNPQMKALEQALGSRRPACMAGMPDHVGAIVENTAITAPADTNENTLKSTSFGYGAISAKGGWRLTATGTTAGGAGTKTMRVYWGGIEIASVVVGAGTGVWSLEINCWNRGTTQTQIISYKCWDGVTLDTKNQREEDVDTG